MLHRCLRSGLLPCVERGCSFAAGHLSLLPSQCQVVLDDIVSVFCTNVLCELGTRQESWGQLCACDESIHRLGNFLENIEGAALWAELVAGYPAQHIVAWLGKVLNTFLIRWRALVFRAFFVPKLRGFRQFSLPTQAVFTTLQDIGRCILISGRLRRQFCAPRLTFLITAAWPIGICTVITRKNFRQQLTPFRPPPCVQFAVEGWHGHVGVGVQHRLEATSELQSFVCFATHILFAHRAMHDAPIPQVGRNAPVQICQLSQVGANSPDHPILQGWLPSASAFHSRKMLLNGNFLPPAAVRAALHQAVCDQRKSVLHRGEWPKESFPVRIVQPPRALHLQYQ